MASFAHQISRPWLNLPDDRPKMKLKHAIAVAITTTAGLTIPFFAHPKGHPSNGGGVARPAGSLVVGTIDHYRIQREWERYPRGGGAISQVDHPTPEEKALHALQDQIKDLRDRQSAASWRERPGLIAKRVVLLVRATAQFAALKNQMVREGQALIDTAESTVRDVVQEIAQRQNLDLVVERSWCHYPRGIDITNDVLLLLNGRAKNELKRIEEHGKQSPER